MGAALRLRGAVLVPSNAGGNGAAARLASPVSRAQHRACAFVAYTSTSDSGVRVLVTHRWQCWSVSHCPSTLQSQVVGNGPHLVVCAAIDRLMC